MQQWELTAQAHLLCEGEFAIDLNDVQFVGLAKNRHANGSSNSMLLRSATGEVAINSVKNSISFASPRHNELFARIIDALAKIDPDITVDTSGGSGTVYGRFFISVFMTVVGVGFLLLAARDDGPVLVGAAMCLIGVAASYHTRFWDADRFMTTTGALSQAR